LEKWDLQARPAAVVGTDSASMTSASAFPDIPEQIAASRASVLIHVMAMACATQESAFALPVSQESIAKQ
jgi:hypothetical protein